MRKNDLSRPNQTPPPHHHRPEDLPSSHANRRWPESRLGIKVVIMVDVVVNLLILFGTFIGLSIGTYVTLDFQNDFASFGICLACALSGASVGWIIAGSL